MGGVSHHRSTLIPVALAVLLAGCATAPHPVAPPQPAAAAPASIQPATAQPSKPAPVVTPPSRAAAVTPAPTVQDREAAVVSSLLSHMSLEQRIGQHFMGFIPRSGIPQEMIDQVKAGYYGGFILYPWNYKNEADVVRITSTLQTAAYEANPSIGLFFSCDQEGGRVAAFRFPEFVQFPSQFDWGQYKDPEFAYSVGYIVGRELMNLGMNMVFAPVLDLYPKADSTIIGDRSLGPDPEVVARLGDAYIKGAQASGIIPVAKHFPGHGSALVDSHLQLPVLDFTTQQLAGRDMLPFADAVKSGVEAVMTAHILFPEIDKEWPVTLSPAILQGVLRDRLGFKGVIISDGLAMGAISKNYSLHETLRQCFVAGIDIILVHTEYDVPTLIKESMSLVRSGEITEAMVNDGARKLLDLKYRHGLIHGVPQGS